MADGKTVKTVKKAQDVFLQQQRQAAPQVVIGKAASSSTGIPAEGLILKPAKRSKEEEERLAKMPSAAMGGTSVNKALSPSGAMGGTVDSRSTQNVRR